ncbi:MAG: endo alpha-1,4 polygalactosaminidase [Kofleriaceae bacterium]
MIRLAALAGLAALTACSTAVDPESLRDDTEQVARLEGAELAAELAASPPHRLTHPFSRIGLVWDAERAEALEVSTSVDGQRWSDWRAPEVHHVEVEDTSSFVGEVGVAGAPARYYRLRAGAGTPTFVRLECMSQSLSASVEDGVEGTAEPSELAVGDLPIHPRADWNARATRCTAGLGSVYRMAIHHTESPTEDSLSPAARLRQTQTYHMDTRGWCDIAYHYLLSRDGQIWEGRAERLLGAHTGGANTGNVGVAVMGSHMTTPINQTQTNTMAALLRGLAQKHGLGINRTVIKGHRQYKSTDCPGNALYGQLDSIVALAASGGGGGGGGGPVKVTVRGVLWLGSDTMARVAGATVTLGGRTTTSAANGSWSFAEVPVGTFTVTATKAGLRTASITRQTDGDPTWASFGMTEDGQTTGTAILQGVVYQGADSANRIAGASISLSTGQTVTADANGFYKLTDLPPGPVTITASKAGFTTASVSRTLANGAVEWGSVRLDPSGGVAVWRPTPGTTWQWQLTGALDTGVTASAYDVDLYETTSAQISALKSAGRKVICYFSAGTYESGRPDSAQFPESVKGAVLPDWPDERWLDHRSATVRQLMAARLDAARAKGCDAVEPDNVDAYANTPGFPLTAAHQLDYNRFLAREAHARGLSIGLKNATDLVSQLVGDFDWALNEECYQFQECATMSPFVSANKAVFHAEYTDDTSATTFRGAICTQTKALGFSSILKDRDLGAARTTCP